MSHSKDRPIDRRVEAAIFLIRGCRNIPHTWSVPFRVSPRHFVFILLSCHVLDDEQLAAHGLKRAVSSAARWG